MQAGSFLSTSQDHALTGFPDDRLTITGADGGALAGDVCGPADGPVMILLHGGGQSRYSWRVAMRRLAAAGYKTCAFDMRGHGDSDWSPDGDYRIERFVADLLVMIDTVGAPAILVGASFGGHVSLAVASQHPSLVRALVLCDVTPWIEGETTKALRATMRTAAAGFASPKDVARHIDLVRGHPSNPDIDKLRRQMRSGADGRLYWRWDAEFFSCQEEESGYIAERLQAAAERLAVPTLLVRAEHSEVVTAEQVSRFVRLVPHAVVAEIEGARHTITREDNNAYASIILKFLEGLGK